jgi:DNA-binding MarR family transcriptional regulator
MQLLPNASSFRFLKAFWGVRQRMGRHINPLMEEKHGLGIADFFLLLHIAKTNSSPSEIAEAMQFPGHSISKRLDSLQKATLIERRLHTDDARKRRLIVTKKGDKVLEQAQKTLGDEINEMLKRLGPDELEQLLALLERIA